MLNTYRQRRMMASEDGFTLLELIITVAIIGILTAIAIPAISWFQAYSTVQGLHANNKEVIKMVQAEYIAAGGVNQFAVGEGTTSTPMANAQALMTEASIAVVARIAEPTPGLPWDGVQPSGLRINVGNITTDGTDLLVCVSSTTNDRTVARTDCSGPSPFLPGPVYGHEQFD